MSLTSKLKVKQVKDPLDRLLPQAEGRLDAPLLVEPRSRRYGLIGTAFDYALRFDLRRRLDRVVRRRWVAEAAADELALAVTGDPDLADEEGFAELMGQAVGVVRDARAFVDGCFVELEDPAHSDLETLAAHSLRLAKLDTFYRSGYQPRELLAVESEDIEEIVELLGAVPDEGFRDVASGPALLNPAFGEASYLVGGADADLIIGDMLLEVKTTKNPRVGKKELRQLVGYAILTNEHRLAGGELPELRSLGVYFARQGHIWTVGYTLDPEGSAYQEARDALFDAS